MVEKPSSGWRACGVYRALNATSEDDRYPMPHLRDFTIQLERKSIFSKVDLVRAYNQVPMNASDIAKTATVMPFGLFEYKRTPFGLKNAAQTFQRLIVRLRMFIWMTFWLRCLRSMNIDSISGNYSVH